ncbi:MAG: hypothetical protein ACR2JV_06195 [Gaiellales bacterium]
MRRPPSVAAIERSLTIPEVARLAGVHRNTMAKRLTKANSESGGKLLFRVSRNGRWYVTRSTLAVALPGLLPKRGLCEDDVAANDAAHLAHRKRHRGVVSVLTTHDTRLDAAEAHANDLATKLSACETRVVELERVVADFRAKAHAWFGRGNEPV